MNRFHFTGNQNELIDKLATIFFISGKPVGGYPKSYKGINDVKAMYKVMSLIVDKLTQEEKGILQDLNVEAILFELKRFFNPILQIHCMNKPVIYITIGSLFTVSQQNLIDPNVAK